MSLRELLEKNRSYRRFDESRPVERQTLVELVDLTRLCPSAANDQPLKYMVVSGAEACAKLFPMIYWAGYLIDWPGPAEGERPTGYIIILADTTIKKQFDIDPGIVAQTIMLGAVERGLGGCMFGSVAREKLRREFSIPAHLGILLVLAIGVPVETVVLEKTPAPAGSVKETAYWRDEAGVHHVPKRPLEDILIGEIDY